VSKKSKKSDTDAWIKRLVKEDRKKDGDSIKQNKQKEPKENHQKIKRNKEER